MPFDTHVSLSQYPDYYLARQKQISDELGQLYATQKDYIPFGNPRVSPMDPGFAAAQTLTENNVGSANPYYTQAMQNIGVGSRPSYENIENYMNPYRNNVSNLMLHEGTRNIDNNIIPFLNKMIIGDNGYTGTRNISWNDSAAKAAKQGLDFENLNLLHKGYEQSSQQSALDRMRLLDSGGLQGRIGSMQHASTLGDVSALENIAQRNQGYAQQKLDIANQDQRRQEEYPWMNLERMGAIMNGMPLNQSQSQAIHATPPPMNVNAAGNIGAIAGQLAGIDQRSTDSFRELTLRRRNPTR